MGASEQPVKRMGCLAAALIAVALLWLIAGSYSIIRYIIFENGKSDKRLIYSNYETTISLSRKIIYRTFFGNFAISLSNIANRGDFYALDAKGEHKFHVRPDSDGEIYLHKLSLAFWMPDGSGVYTRPSHLESHVNRDEESGNSYFSPMRPIEAHHDKLDLSNYVVMIGSFCPVDRIVSKSMTFSRFENEIVGTGFGYGALLMYDCSEVMPDKIWQRIENLDASKFNFYCKKDARYCFGWIYLREYDVKALTFIPSDAVGKLPEISACLLIFLKKHEIN